MRYLRQVIEKLDIRRKQVFVEAVILELASDDQFDIGLGAHLGKPGDDGSLSIFPVNSMVLPLACLLIF